VKFPKKKALVPRKKKKKSKALVPGSEKEYLIKQQSLRLLVDKSMRIADVAVILKTTPVTIKSFLADDSFREELEERIDRIHGMDKDQRIESMKITLLSLQHEMRTREATGELTESSNRDIHKMIMDTQKELRLDTPGDVTSKVGVADLGKLQDRFGKSLSGKLHRMGKTASRKKKKMKRIERVPASKDEYEENRSSVG